MIALGDIVKIVDTSSNLSGIFADEYRLPYRTIGFETDGDRRVILKYPDGPLYFYPSISNYNTLPWQNITDTPTTFSGYGIIDTLPWTNIDSTPTTLSGYGITDGNQVTRAVGFVSYDSDEYVTVGSGTSYWCVTSQFSGVNIVGAGSSVVEAGASGTLTVQIRRVRDQVSNYILSTPITISDVYYSENGVVNPDYSDIETGDIFFVDVQTVHSGVAPMGLSTSLVFE